MKENIDFSTRFFPSQTLPFLPVEKERRTKMIKEIKELPENYRITRSFPMHDKTIVLGITLDKEKNSFCAIFTNNSYEDCIAGNHSEIMQLFHERTESLCDKNFPDIDYKHEIYVVTKNMCYENFGTSNENLIGKVVAIKASTFPAAYGVAENQLMYITGGSGSYSHDIGKPCYGINLSNGNLQRIERYQLQGILKFECFPEWAVNRLFEIKDKLSKETFKRKDVVR